MIQRAHKIKINPTLEQKQWLLKACGVARFVFNWGLAEWRRQYENGEKPSSYRLKKQFNAIRHKEFPWSLEVSKCAIDSGFHNLDVAFVNFFRRCKNGNAKKGYPNFKSKKMSRLSFKMDGSRIKLDGHWIKLEKLDEPINISEVLRFNGEVKSVTFSRGAGYWYAAVNVEIESLVHEHPKESVGVDLGVKTLAVLSDGQQFENQKLLRLELRKLKRLSRKLSRRQNGSNRWDQTKRKLAKLHHRIADRRLDYQHKMTAQIASTFRIVGVEDLNVKGMLKNRHLALSIADAGFGEIQRQLRYKTERYNGKLVEIDRFFPSSRLCSVCGAIKKDLTLNDRVFACRCGYTADRDLNAAQNIEQQALRVLAGVGSPRGKTDVDRMLDSSEQFWMKHQNLAEGKQPPKPTVIW